MSDLTCLLSIGVQELLKIYFLLMVAYALASWIPSLRGRWLDWISRCIDPVLIPVRRVVPPIGGIDLAFFIVAFVVNLLASSIVPTACYYHYV